MTHMDDHKKKRHNPEIDLNILFQATGCSSRHQVWLPFCVDPYSLFLACRKKKNRWALIRPRPPPQKKHTRSKKRGSYFPRTILQNVALWLLRRALRKEKQASSYGGLLQMKGFAMSDSVCQSPAGLFSLWNAIAPRDTPLSLHHLGTSWEQRAASAEQTARRPHRLTTILPTALSAGCHDSMGVGGGDSRNQNIAPTPKQFPNSSSPQNPGKLISHRMDELQKFKGALCSFGDDILTEEKVLHWLNKIDKQPPLFVFMTE